MSKLQEAAAQSEQPPAPSFRKRTLDRLQTESGERVEPPEVAGSNEVEPPVLDDPVGAGGTMDDGYAGAEPAATPEAEAADLSTEPDAESQSEAAEEPGTESEPEEGSAAFYQAQLAASEESRATLEKEYRLESASIAEVKAAWETKLAQTASEAEFYYGQAQQAMQQKYGNVNWEALKADPAEYQKVAQVYQRDMNVLEQTKARRDGLVNSFNEGVDKFKEQQAELSRNILKKTVPGWSNERVLALRGRAEADGLYAGKDFDQLVDWQTMYLLDHYEKTKHAAAELTAPRKTRGTKPRAAANKQHLPQRNAKGQFEAAKKDFHASPGNKPAGRAFFMAKLAAERESGRR